MTVQQEGDDFGSRQPTKGAFYAKVEAAPMAEQPSVTAHASAESTRGSRHMLLSPVATLRSQLREGTRGEPNVTHIY